MSEHYLIILNCEDGYPQYIKLTEKEAMLDSDKMKMRVMERIDINLENYDWMVSDTLELTEITEDTNIRLCSNKKCPNPTKNIKEGYCIENGEEYYCCDDCLHSKYTDEEFQEMYDDGNGDTYYTEWEKDD